MTTEEKQEILDELVHQVFSEMASKVNNDGMKEQRAFLINQANFTEEELKELLGE